MEHKTKFIIIGLAGFSLICLFLFIQATSSQQMLVRERNDLKNENAALTGKINQLEGDLKENQRKLSSLKGERDKAAQELTDLQGKFEQASRARDELVTKLEQQQSRMSSQAPVIIKQEEPAAPDTADAYWAGVLKAKADLEMQLSSIRGDLKMLQINNESLQRDKNALEIDIKSLSNEKKDLLRQLDYNQKLLDSIAQDVVREKNDKAKIQDNLKIIKNENLVYSRQLKSLNNRKAALEKKIQELQEGKSTVEKRLNEMEAMLADRVLQIDSLKNDLDMIGSGKVLPPPPALKDKPKESVELPAIVVRSLPSAGGNDKAGHSDSSGRILAVNPESNFVVIDIGASSGIKNGDTFNVYREGKSIGSIEVIQARGNISACDIRKKSTALRIGDSIK
jgi:predicted  nucleic acid-binding Zn-ribbon protein